MVVKKPLFWVFVYTALIFMLLFNLIPFFWMTSSSLKSDYEVIDYPPTVLPKQVTFGAYTRMWTQEQFFQYFLNSITVSSSTAFLSSLVGVFAAYGFSRFIFRGRTSLITIFLGSQLIPGVLLVGPYFKMLSYVDLYDTLTGLILSQTTITLPFSIWMLKGYVDTVPDEIDQAAMVDGASRLRICLTVVLPNILPGLVATVIFAFLLSWGDLLWALCLISDQTKQTMTLGITQLVGQFRVQWSEIMAATVMVTIVPATLYLILQRYLIKGFTEGAVKQ
ncbi:MAG: carbohydrate ABC transporter permease [Deltaproteobacteria bacterium]|nr:carbohydrate ABC transporter permease [Deltaproteobacteria bacterium]MBW2152693.1 carbohydrate ABC transporter permease [Deltaproteobacteria bacterium]